MRKPNTLFNPNKDVEPTRQEGPESAEPTSQNNKETWCSQCKNVKFQHPHTRCKGCNTIYNRALECKKKLDRGSIEAYDKMTKEKKAEFIELAKDHMGKELKAKLQIFISKEVEMQQSIRFSAAGRFLDSPDLAEKYKNKPKQLERIRANTRKVDCPTRGCTLYEDPSYESNSTATETITEKRKMDFAAEEIIPQPKKPKVDNNKNTEAEEANKLNEGQQTKLGVWTGYLETCKKN